MFKVLVNKFFLFFLVFIAIAIVFVKTAFAGSEYCAWPNRGTTINFANHANTVWELDSIVTSALSWTGVPSNDVPEALSIIPANTGSYFTFYPSEGIYDFNYKNNLGDVVTFRVQVASDSLSDSTVTNGQYYATKTSATNDCVRDPNDPHVDYSLNGPPKQRVSIDIEFASAQQANIASRGIESLIDTDLTDSLDMQYGKPIEVTVTGNTVKLSFYKLCDNNACGYN